MSYVPPPGTGRNSATSPFAIAHAVVTSHADYWSHALARGPAVVDIAMDTVDWWREITRREVPQWASPNRVVAEWPVARLRDFSVGTSTNVIPTLLLPPQAGHDSCIVDFAPGQSQVQAAREAGLNRLWSLDWIGATVETRDATIEDYIDLLDEAVDQIGGPVNLIGDCQGGWLAVVYAALRPERVHTLTIAGAPVDFHAGDALIHDWLRLLTPGGDLTFYESVVGLNGGVLPGWFLLGGFIAMQPETELGRQLQLFAGIRDLDHVSRYRNFETWFKHTQPIPGAFYLWIVRHLFRDNELVQRRLRVGGELVDLRRISCPLFLLAGESDHITPAAQVFALASASATPADQVVQDLVSGGHLGLFMGRVALHEHWPRILKKVHELSCAG